MKVFAAFGAGDFKNTLVTPVVNLANPGLTLKAGRGCFEFDRVVKVLRAAIRKGHGVTFARYLIGVNFLLQDDAFV